MHTKMINVLLLTSLANWSFTTLAETLDIDKLITNQQSEAYAKTPKGKTELYLQGHNYSTIHDFLVATRKEGRFGQKEWEDAPHSYYIKDRPYSRGNGFGGGYAGPGDFFIRPSEQLDLKKEYYPPVVARSFLIKTLLEKDSNVIVPFDTSENTHGYTCFFVPELKRELCEEQLYRRTVPSDPEYKFAFNPEVKLAFTNAQKTCALITPRLLSNGIMAIGYYTVTTREFKNPNGRLTVKDKTKLSLEYLSWLFETLNARCNTQDHSLNGERSFIDAYKKLLNDYASALEASYQDSDATIAKENAERAAAEKEKHAALEKSRLNMQFAENKRLNERLVALRDGKIKPETMEDAKLLWQPSNGIQVVLNPPVTGDSNTYLLSGKLVRAEGDRHVFEINTGNDIKYFICVIQSDTVLTNGTLLRYEGKANIVGRFVGVASYTTVLGVTRMAPVFNTLLIQN